MTALSWEIVDVIAAELGASEAQRRKWRQTGRQVPDGWRIRIADALRLRGQDVAFAAFDDLPPRPGRLDIHAAANMPPAPAAAPGKRSRHSRPQDRICS